MESFNIKEEEGWVGSDAEYAEPESSPVEPCIPVPHEAEPTADERIKVLELELENTKALLLLEKERVAIKDAEIIELRRDIETFTKHFSPRTSHTSQGSDTHNTANAPHRITLAEPIFSNENNTANTLIPSTPHRRMFPELALSGVNSIANTLTSSAPHRTLAVPATSKGHRPKHSELALSGVNSTAKRLISSTPHRTLSVPATSDGGSTSEPTATTPHRLLPAVLQSINKSITPISTPERTLPAIVQARESHDKNLEDVISKVLGEPVMDRGVLFYFEIQPEVLRDMHFISNNPTVLARELMKKLYTPHERLNCNVRGVGKPQFDKYRMETIKVAVFRLCGIPWTERDTVWRSCIKVIDQANRNARKSPLALLY